MSDDDGAKATLDAEPGSAAVRDPVVEFLRLRFSDQDADKIAERLRQATPDEIARLFLTDDEIAKARRLPPEKIAALRQHVALDLDAELATFERAWEASGRSDFFQVLAALNCCRFARRPLPDWIDDAIRPLIVSRLPQKQSVDCERWYHARRWLESLEESWNTVFERVAKLEGEATGKLPKASSVKNSYTRIENTLPLGARWKSRKGAYVRAERQITRHKNRRPKLCRDCASR